MARLRIVSGEGVEQVLEVSEQRLQIGRGRDNDVVLPDPEKGVSRTHAELRLENDRYVIVDLQSQNGTYVNGARVDRAEVAYGAEIAVGGYRLTLLRDGTPGARPAAHIPRPDPVDDMRATGPHAPPAYTPPAAPRAEAAAGPAPWAMGLAVAALVMIALVATVWISGKRRQEDRTAGDAVDVTGATHRTTLYPSAVSRSRPHRRLQIGRPVLWTMALSRGRRRQSRRQGPEPTRARRASDGDRVSRWTHGAAAAPRCRCATSTSTAALTRGDFAAAAGGFEAILIEEPGFLDAPGLLVEAQSGLRSSARRLFQAGQKLEAAGDWVGALQKYEQARQIYVGVEGLSASIQQVRGKLRTAGTAAFNEGRQHEAAGRTDEALKAYDKAVQWLPLDDPNRQVARSRIEQLKRTIEEYARGQQ